MASEPQAVPNPDDPHEHGHGTGEMPRPAAAPLVMSLGMALFAAGVAFGLAFFVTGVAVFVVGLGLWSGQLLPGRGHVHEPLAEPALRPREVTATTGTVAHLKEGMPGYRFRLPLEVHPVSAGVKGGVAGGLLMLLPALAWGVLSGHGDRKST